MQINSYIYGTSLYHKADVRAKLMVTVLMSIALFLIKSPLFLFTVALSIIIISLLSLGMSETIRCFKRLMLIIIFLFIAIPFNREGNPLIAVSGFTIATDAALASFVRSSSRFVAISYLYFLLIDTTRPDMLLKGLRWYRLSYDSALMVSMVLRFIPHLESVYHEIRASMSLRLQEGKRGYPIVPSLIALLVQTVKMIPNTAASLSERGYGRKTRKDTKALPFDIKALLELLSAMIIPLVLILMSRL